MLAERLATIYRLLQCSNTDLAGYAGCSPSNISRLKSGLREPKPTSRTIALLANGIYGYADYENLLPVLAELCGVEDTGPESLIPAVIAWLFDTAQVTLPAHGATPRSKQTKARQRQSFGERLDQAMTLLELTNGQLSALLSVDDSLVSRYRAGIYSPHGNERLAEKLSAVLCTRAQKNGKAAALAQLCGTEEAALDPDAVAAWLYRSTPEEDSVAVARRLLHSLDDFAPGQGLSPAPPVPEIPPAARYVGTEGLRAAVVRFLADAAREGGELLLYSDEPMDWMSGDRAYFSLWAALMAECVRSGVRIKIIHNVDRDGQEMVNAIQGWFPLYLSGRIEPYVSRRERNPRFHHTVFLRAGHACIHGFSPVGSGEDRWYEYVTDPQRLGLLAREFSAMLSAASPFLEIYTAAMGEEFHRTRIRVPGTRDYLLHELPLVTMPEDLLARMLARSPADPQQKKTALAQYRDLRSLFEEALREESVNMIFCLPDPGGQPRHRLNFALSLAPLSIAYTREEYARHVGEVLWLVEQEKNFHLTLLPASPFRDIQIVTRKDAVAILRGQEPYGAFVFLNPTLRESVSAYFASLIHQYATDRAATAEALRQSLLGP